MQQKKQIMYRVRVFVGKAGIQFYDIALMFASAEVANNFMFDLIQGERGVHSFDIAGNNNKIVTILAKDCKPVEKFDLSLFKPVTYGIKQK